MKPQRIFLSPPHLGGEEQLFIKEAFESNFIAPLGPQVDAFEREFCECIGAKHAVALSSGTAAIHIALRLLGVGPGDEVLASTMTFIGSITPVTYQGAIPVFIDCDDISWTMDPSLLEQELFRCNKKGQLPKAVIPTDLYGQSVDMAHILDICGRYGVPVVCDTAEALGATYTVRQHQGANCKSLREMIHGPDAEFIHAGIGAKAAIFSFNGNKIITTSGGGMLVSDDEVFIEKARFLSQQARDPFPHYEHSEIGYNYRMSNIIAAIGRGQLRVLENRVARRKKIFDYYKDALDHLPGIAFMPEAPYGVCTRWLTAILITPELFGADREAVRLALEDGNIESRPVWKPMHLQPVFNNPSLETFDCPSPHANGEITGIKGYPPAISYQGDRKQVCHQRYPCRVVGGSISEDLFQKGLCLPSGTAMSEGDLDRIVRVIQRMCRY